jgi:AcrR family transcriptional regulator
MSEVTITKEDKIRADVIIASQKLFKRHGYAKTTMDDIAKAMGKKKSTLYYYYKSKDEILEATLLYESNDVLNRISNATNNISTTKERLRCYILEYFKLVHEKTTEYDVLQEEIRNGEIYSINRSFISNYLAELNEKHKLIIRGIFAIGIKENEFRKEILDDIEDWVDIVFTIIVSVSTVFTIGFINEIYGKNEVKRLTLLADLILRGLTA